VRKQVLEDLLLLKRCITLSRNIYLTMLRDFLLFEWGKIPKYFRTKKAAKVITSILFILVFALVALGIYSFFTTAFRFIQYIIEEEFRLPLTLFLYEVFFILLSGVIVFSALVTGVFQFFRGEYDAWILASPRFSLLPKLVFVKGVLASVWPLLVMFVPAVLAFNKFHSLGFASLSLVVLSVISLVILLNALTSVIVVLLGELYNQVSQKVKRVSFSFKGYIALLAFVLFVGLSYTWTAIRSYDFVKLFKAEDVDSVLAMSEIGNKFIAFPTHPFAKMMVTLQTEGEVAAISYAGVLVVLAVVSVCVWWYISRFCYGLWQRFQEGSRVIALREGAFSSPKKAYLFTGGSTYALFKKEFLVMTRNMKGVFWLLFLLFIWMSQIIIMVISRHNIIKYEADISDRLASLYAFQFVIASYFICAFTLRFVFPSFSVERKTAWLLASAPLSFKKLFLSKAAFFSVFFVSLGLLMNLVSSILLKMAPVNAFYSLTLFVSVVITVVTFGVVLGVFFPNNESDDPDVISTSLPGLFFTMMSLLYGALGAIVYYYLLTDAMVPLFIVFVVASLLLSAGMFLSVFQKKGRVLFTRD
jgi:hypothetical protein